jgi:hypothetical protein
VNGIHVMATIFGMFPFLKKLFAAEWNLVEPLIPPGKRGGGKRTVVMREVTVAIKDPNSTRLWQKCSRI